MSSEVPANAPREFDKRHDGVLPATQLELGDWTFGPYDPAVSYAGSPLPGCPIERKDLSDLRNGSTVLSELSSLDWSFDEHDTGYLSHDLHPYPAKFIPQIPATLVCALTIRGELVWDPFGGSGTTAVEAVLRQRRAMSTDANPLAAVIGQAKTTTLTPEDLTALNRLRERTMILSREAEPLRGMSSEEQARLHGAIPPIPHIDKWFHPVAVRELAMIRVLYRGLTAAASRVATVAFSRIVTRASFQDSETRYAAKPREVSVGSVLRMYAIELGNATLRVCQLGAAVRFRTPAFATADVRQDVVASTPGAILPPASVALVVTSPPYPNSMDYHLYHRFRLYWLGHDPRDLGRVEIGSHLRHQRERTGFDNYVEEMRQCMRNIHSALQPGRYAVFVVGDCVYEGRVYETDRYFAEIGASIGFEVVGNIERPVHRTRRSFIPAARRAQSESIVILRRAPSTLAITLHGPPYRMWDYEVRLQAREAEQVLGVRREVSTKSPLTGSIDCYDLPKASRLTFTHEVDFHTGETAPLRTWQSILENGDTLDPSSRKDPKYATHGIHPYKGKFYPQLAKSLFNLARLEPGQVVLDPYCGSGTVLLEAKLNGLRSYGFDINPLAVRIAQAKCASLDEDPVIADRLMAAILQRLETLASSHPAEDLSAFDEPLLPELKSWFPLPVLYKLSRTLKEIDTVPSTAMQELFRVLLSSIVRDVSLQDPHDLRIRRRTDPVHDGPIYELLAARVAETRGRLTQFAARLDRCPVEILGAEASIVDTREGSAVATALAGRTDGGVDAVVTSPPYATALPYVDTYRLNMLAIWGFSSARRMDVEAQTIGSREITISARRGVERELSRADCELYDASEIARMIVLRLFEENTDDKVGFRRLNMAALIYRYFTDMLASMRSIDRSLRVGGNVFMVVGDNQTVTGLGPVVIETTAVIHDLGKHLGWSLVDRIPITVTKENYRHSRNAITKNTILWMTK